MRKLLPDLFAAAGFVAMMAGVIIQFGEAWALMIGGLMLLAIGIAAAWRNK